MFVGLIKKTGSTDDKYVCIMEGYRNEKGQVRHRIVEKLGLLSELQKKNPNILEELKAKYAKKREDKKEREKKERLAFAQEIINLGKGIPPTTRRYNNQPALIYYDNLSVKQIWSHELKMQDVIEPLVEDSPFAQDLPETLAFMVAHIITKQRSANFAYVDNVHYLGSPACSQQYEGFCSVYDFLKEIHDQIFEYVNKMLAQNADGAQVPLKGNKLAVYDLNDYIRRKGLDYIYFYLCNPHSYSIALVLSNQGFPLDVLVIDKTDDRKENKAKLDALKAKYHISSNKTSDEEKVFSDYVTLKSIKAFILERVTSCFFCPVDEYDANPKVLDFIGYIQSVADLTVLGLLVLSIIKKKLKDLEPKLRFEHIVTILDSFTLLFNYDEDGKPFFRLYNAINLRLLKEFNDPYGIVLQACGLTSPTKVCDLNILNKALGTKYKSEHEAISALVLNQYCMPDI